jgi:hypothetical protein
MTQSAEVMQDTYHPKETMAAVPDDRAAAGRAAQALRVTGFAEDNMYLLNGVRPGRGFSRKKPIATSSSASSTPFRRWTRRVDATARRIIWSRSRMGVRTSSARP